MLDDDSAQCSLDESQTQSTRYGNCRPLVFLPVNRNYLTDVYGSSVLLNYTGAVRFLGARRVLRTTSGGNIVVVSRGVAKHSSAI